MDRDGERSMDRDQERSMDRAPAAAARCPRCGSANTKFCYYNNYSVAQPRHLCKSCRRYWTHGGALRNVPVGGRKKPRPRTTIATNIHRFPDHHPHLSSSPLMSPSLMSSSLMSSSSAVDSQLPHPNIAVNSRMTMIGAGSLAPSPSATASLDDHPLMMPFDAEYRYRFGSDLLRPNLDNYPLIRSADHRPPDYAHAPAHTTAGYGFDVDDRSGVDFSPPHHNIAGACSPPDDLHLAMPRIGHVGCADHRHDRNHNRNHNHNHNHYLHLNRRRMAGSTGSGDHPSSSFRWSGGQYSARNWSSIAAAGNPTSTI